MASSKPSCETNSDAHYWLMVNLCRHVTERGVQKFRTGLAAVPSVDEDLILDIQRRSVYYIVESLLEKGYIRDGQYRVLKQALRTAGLIDFLKDVKLTERKISSQEGLEYQPKKELYDWLASMDTSESGYSYWWYPYRRRPTSEEKSPGSNLTESQQPLKCSTLQYEEERKKVLHDKLKQRLRNKIMGDDVEKFRQAVLRVAASYGFSMEISRGESITNILDKMESGHLMTEGDYSLVKKALQEARLELCSQFVEETENKIAEGDIEAPMATPQRYATDGIENPGEVDDDEETEVKQSVPTQRAQGSNNHSAHTSTKKPRLRATGTQTQRSEETDEQLPEIAYPSGTGSFVNFNPQDSFKRYRGQGAGANVTGGSSIGNHTNQAPNVDNSQTTIWTALVIVVYFIYTLITR